MSARKRESSKTGQTKDSQARRATSKRVVELEKLVRHHRELYYKHEPEISDEEFDALVDELQELAPSSVVLEEVGAPVDVGGVGLPTKAHKIPMGSLDKVPGERLEAWAEKAGPLFLAQEKLDGISLELEYEDGRLVDAITRGDGFVGEVITHNAVHFKNVRRRLPRPFTGSVRGEVVLRLSDFREHFEPQGFANPRNTVSGTARKKHGDRSLCRHFEVFCFDVVGEDAEFETEREKMAYLRDALDLDTAVSYEAVKVDDVKRIFAEYAGDPTEGVDGKRAELDYEIDGLVVRSDSIALQRELGVVGNRPRYAMAYKFVSQGRVTRLNAVDWSLGLGGRVTPIARLEPVRIAGVTISNAILHNLDYLRNMDLRIGDRVLVERKGDVIPQVVKVIESEGGETPGVPANCPSCGTELELDGKFLRCRNTSCPGRLYGDIQKWVNELDIDAIGEKWIEIFLQNGLIAEPEDLYELTVERLLPLERMGQTLAEKVIRNIESMREPPLDRFLAGLNIPEFSRQRAQMLIDAGYDTLEKILELEAEAIADVKGFADVLARKVHDGLRRKQERLEGLRRVGVWPRRGEPTPVTTAVDGVLEGKSYCFTGAVQAINPDSGKRWTRKELQDLVKQHGGQVASSVSKGLDYLVMADPDSTSSKAKKARELGTEILSEADFLQRVGAKSEA